MCAGRKWTLLIGERVYRGDPRGAMRWHQTSDQRNDTDYRGGAGKDRRLKWPHLKEQRPQRLSGEPCSYDAENRADREQAECEG